MARNTSTPDAGSYNHPAIIQKQAAYADNGSGGNANAGQWVTVRGGDPSHPLMIGLHSGKFGRGLKLTYKYGQQYPEADHYVQMRYTSDDVESAGMRLVVNNRNFRILGAIDEDLRHHETIMPCVEELAKGSV